MKPETRFAALADPSVIERLIGARPMPKIPAAKDFVRAYSHAIKAARENGWTVDQIHAELQSAGVQIEIRTLRKYVNDVCGAVRKRSEPRTGLALEQIAPAAILEVNSSDSNGVPRSLRRSHAGKV